MIPAKVLGIFVILVFLSTKRYPLPWQALRIGFAMPKKQKSFSWKQWVAAVNSLRLSYPSYHHMYIRDANLVDLLTQAGLLDDCPQSKRTAKALNNAFGSTTPSLTVKILKDNPTGICRRRYEPSAGAELKFHIPANEKDTGKAHHFYYLMEIGESALEPTGSGRWYEECITVPWVKALPRVRDDNNDSNNDPNDTQAQGEGMGDESANTSLERNENDIEVATAGIESTPRSSPKKRPPDDIIDDSESKKRPAVAKFDTSFLSPSLPTLNVEELKNISNEQ